MRVEGPAIVDDATIPLKNITDFKVILISSDHNEKYHRRKVETMELLKRIGFSQIEHYRSGTDCYPRCLTNAVFDILLKHIDEPILVVEDDVDWSGIAQVHVPAEADAIYFGISRHAGSATENKDDGFAVCTPWSQSQVRVQNMLSGHAILFLSRAYKQAIIDALKPRLGERCHHDIIMSRLQSKFTVLANRKPIFYQARKFNMDNTVEYATNFIIE